VSLELTPRTRFPFQEPADRRQSHTSLHTKRMYLCRYTPTDTALRFPKDQTTVCVRKVIRCTPIECTHFPNVFFEVLNMSFVF